MDKKLNGIFGLEEFSITDYKISKEEIHIHIQIKAKQARCPRCGRWSKSIHQYHERKVRDLDIFGRRCYLVFNIRRFDCPYCNRPFTEQLNSIGYDSEYTKRFEDWISKWARNSSLSEVAGILCMSYDRVEGILFRTIERQIKANKGCICKKIGIDEISLKKGKGNYIVIITDLKRGCVIGVLENRSKEKVKEWFQNLSTKQRQRIRWVAIDMWDGYFYAVRQELPWAKVVIDRFHVQKALGEQVDKARRHIQRRLSDEERKELKGSRWIILKPKDKLTQEQRVAIETMCDKYPELGKLYDLKEGFRAIYENKTLSPITARESFDKWQINAKELGIMVINNFLNTLKNWYQWILNYFGVRLTSGVVEGMNTKIKLLKRTGFGFRNFKNFRLRIFGACG